MALDPDRRSNLFSEPAHQCAATCITEISLIETLSAKNEPAPKIDISGKNWIKTISNVLKMLKMKCLPFTSKGINSEKTCQLKKNKHDKFALA